MNARLRRVLALVAAASARQGRTVDELAAILGCTTREVRDDIEFLACVGAPPFSPDDLLDIELRDDEVYVEYAAGLDKPMRLTATETAVLVAAARALAPADPTLDRATTKLRNAVHESQRASFDALVARMAPAVSSASDLLPVIERAAADRKVLEIRYFAPGDLAPRVRRILPLRVVSTDGVLYLSAMRDGEHRQYRIDRIASADPTGETFAAGVAAAVVDTAPLDARQDLSRATVRFDEPVADVARSRHPGGTKDGARYDASIAYASEGWLVSYVLSWGGAARVVGPPAAKISFETAVRRVLDAHGDST